MYRFKEEFNKSYKGKFFAKPFAALNSSSEAGGDVPLQRQVKRRKTSPPVWHDSSLTQILTDHSVSDAEAELNVAAKDELVEYLSLPQIPFKKETDAITWWYEHDA